MLGIGNLLMGDEGVGVHAVNYIKEENVPLAAHVLDGGTGGFHLLSLFADYDPIIIIDATMDDKTPGTATLLEPRFASDFPKTLSAHDIGLRDLVESAAITGPLPKLYLIAVSIHDIRSMVTELSPAVQESLPKVVEIARDLLNSENNSA